MYRKEYKAVQLRDQDVKDLFDEKKVLGVQHLNAASRMINALKQYEKDSSFPAMQFISGNGQFYGRRYNSIHSGSELRRGMQFFWQPHPTDPTAFGHFVLGTNLGDLDTNVAI